EKCKPEAIRRGRRIFLLKGAPRRENRPAAGHATKNRKLMTLKLGRPPHQNTKLTGRETEKQPPQQKTPGPRISRQSLATRTSDAWTRAPARGLFVLLPTTRPAGGLCLIGGGGRSDHLERSFGKLPRN